MFPFQALVLLVLAAWVAKAEDYCSRFIVPPCANRAPRDVLFIVDGSNSMEAKTFYTGMLDYTLALYCAFEPTVRNQAGMIIFNQGVEVHIPLGPYSRERWEQQVETVRDTQHTNYPACCSCCTPMAEAFLAATEEFKARQINQLRIAFVITDGVPSNNYVNAPGGNPLWWFNSFTKDFDPAQYSTQIVPAAANALKAAGHRLLLVGVPGSSSTAMDIRYFNGQYKNNYNYCINRDMAKYCAPYVLKGNFPIVSLPVSENSFVMNDWDVNTLVKNTAGGLCQLPPTMAPTSQAPTKLPTESPTTSSPTFSPTEQPTATPTQSPTLKPTTLAPTARPTSQRPSKSPTRTPTARPTSQAPSRVPTSSPTALVLEQVDVTFLIDRSNSMNWLADTCQKVIDSIGQSLKTLGNETQTEATKSMCWELFLRYVLTQADSVAEIVAGENKDRLLGWAADFPQDTIPAKGLRVNVIGFACENAQRTPKVFSFSDSILGGPVTKRSDLVLLLEELRTTVMPTGGTCPALAIEYMVKTVESQTANLYPLQTAILLTDGVFYDGAAPEMATLGLEAYNVLRFAVGIAIANTQHKYGLTSAEIQTQKSQLTKFVGGRTNQFKDLGSDGFFALLDIADNIAADLKDYYYYNVRGDPKPRYSWCGFRRIHNCQSNNWRKRNCQWVDSNVKEYGCSSVSAAKRK